MNAFLALLGLIVIVGAEAGCLGSSGAQPPSIVGRWRVEFALSGSQVRHLQFEANSSGKGAFLLLDPRSNLVPPAAPTKAVWRQSSSGEVNFSGVVEFPIGNVGRQAGALTFNGAFDSPDLISGAVSFIESTADGQKQTGKFTATRVQPPTVRLISLNTGEKLRRGETARLEWEVQSARRIISQQILLSVDNGATFDAISEKLGGDARSYIWEVPETLSKTKKAVIKIVVADEEGDIGEDVTDRVFRIR